MDEVHYVEDSKEFENHKVYQKVGWLLGAI